VTLVYHIVKSEDTPNSF